MENSSFRIWETSAARQFASVLAAIDNPAVIQNFLRDVMTEKEIIEISARLKAADMLRAGKKYTEIIEATKLSSRTVARINEWLRHGHGGYDAALHIIHADSVHLTPVPPNSKVS